MIAEIVIPESSMVEITIIGLETMSKTLDDRLSPTLRMAISLRRVIASSFVVIPFRRERSFDLIKISGSPRYSAPIRALASKPDNKTASSGYDNVTENRAEATKRIAMRGYRMTFIIERGTAWFVR
jgi:uncharacterized membrane-anchored protein